MRNMITYEQIRPLVKHVEITSDMIHCHFHCPIKSKKIVAITRFSKLHPEQEPTPLGLVESLKKYLYKDEIPETAIDVKMEKENAIVHAFGKISERFVWSDVHKHFIYRF